MNHAWERDYKYLFSFHQILKNDIHASKNRIGFEKGLVSIFDPLFI